MFETSIQMKIIGLFVREINILFSLDTKLLIDNKYHFKTNKCISLSQTEVYESKVLIIIHLILSIN